MVVTETYVTVTSLQKNKIINELLSHFNRDEMSYPTASLKGDTAYVQVNTKLIVVLGLKLKVFTAKEIMRQIVLTVKHM